MLKFTIRELLLLTLVIALGLGWALRERQFREERQEASQWRAQVNALEFLAATEGLEIEWKNGRSVVTLQRQLAEGAKSSHTVAIERFHGGPFPDRPRVASEMEFDVANP